MGMAGGLGRVLVAGLALACGAPGAHGAQACGAALAGVYAARHMEMGGGLELRADGRFAYALSYGAVDEAAAGRWTCDGEGVVLTSDPVDPPRFVVLGSGPGPTGRLQVVLELPEGMSRQYFRLAMRGADGAVREQDFAEDGLTLAFGAGDRPVALVPLLPLFEVAGAAIAMPAGDGVVLRLRFEPHDLGKVAFDHARVRRDGGALIVSRFGEAIRFVASGR